MTANPTPTLNDFRERTQEAMQSGNPAELERWVSGLQKGELEIVIEKLADVVDSLKPKYEPPPPSKPPVKRKWWLYIGGSTFLGLTIICVVILVYLMIFRGVNIFTWYDKDKNQITPIPSFTLTPTLTTTPTPTPTATPTSTPTPTRAPLVDSIYKKIYSEILLQPPINHTDAWLVDVSAEVIPSLLPYKETSGNSALEIYQYTLTDTLTISWKMDVGLDEGLYLFSVIDTKQYSAGEQTFQVLLDDKPVDPYRSRSTVMYNDNRHKQVTADWLPIGFYQIGYNQVVKVMTQISSYPNDIPHSVTPLLIQPVKDVNKAIITWESPLDNDRPIIKFMDDSMGTFKVNDTTANRSLTTQTGNAWNGSYRRYQANNKHSYSFTWQSAGQIQPGKYQLLVWLPENSESNVKAVYQLVVNDKPVVASTSGEITQNVAGWVDAGTFDIPEAGPLQVVMKVDTPEIGSIAAFDLVALALIP